MAKSFRETINLTGMKVTQISMIHSLDITDVIEPYIINVTVSNGDITKEINIQGSEFPAIMGIIDGAFETAENKLVNWSKGKLTEDMGE